MKKLIITLAAVLSLAAAIPANTQDDPDSAAWQAKFLTSGVANCNLWNVNDGGWKQGYLYGFGNGYFAGSLLVGYLTNSNSAMTNSQHAFNLAIPSKLNYGEISARVDYACSQPANAAKTLSGVIAKIAADVNQ